MGRITDRLRRVEQHRRRRPQQRVGGYSWKRKLLTGFLTLGLITSLCFYTFLVGYQMNGDEITANTMAYTVIGEMPQDSEVNQTYYVDDYRIRFLHPDSNAIEGLWGYTFGEDSRSIYIQAGLPPSIVYSTCVHEKLHTKGIGEEYHDFIGEHEDRIVDETCLRLLYLMNGSQSRVP